MEINKAGSSSQNPHVCRTSRKRECHDQAGQLFLKPAVLKSCVMTFQCSSHKKMQLIREKITIQFAAMDTSITDKVVIDSIVHKLNQFTPTTEKELERIIRDCPAKTCSLDHCPTDVLKKTLQCQLSYLVTLATVALIMGYFQSS